MTDDLRLEITEGFCGESVAKDIDAIPFHILYQTKLISIYVCVICVCMCMSFNAYMDPNANRKEMKS